MNNENTIIDKTKNLSLILFITQSCALLYLNSFDSDAVQIQFLEILVGILAVYIPVILFTYAVTAYKDSIGSLFLNSLKLSVIYLFAGVFYSMFTSQMTAGSFGQIFQYNVLGGNWTGSLILMVLQIILLTAVLKYFGLYKYAYHKYTLWLSLLANVVFLYLNSTSVTFNFNGLTAFNTDILISNWIFIYCLGSFIGRHFERFVEFLREQTTILITLTVTTLVAGFLLAGQLEFLDMVILQLPYFVAGALMIMSIVVHFSENSSTFSRTISETFVFNLLTLTFILPMFYEATSVFIGNTFFFLLITTVLSLSTCVGMARIFEYFLLQFSDQLIKL